MALTISHNVSIKKCRSLYLVYFIEKWLDISSDHDSGKKRGKPANFVGNQHAILSSFMTMEASKEMEKQSLEVFFKKSDVKDLEKFTGKHLCQGLFFNKVSGLKSAFLSKKKTLLTQVFSYEFCQIFKNTFFKDILFYISW